MISLSLSIITITFNVRIDLVDHLRWLTYSQLLDSDPIEQVGNATTATTNIVVHPLKHPGNSNPF